MSELTREQIEELFERSKNDHAMIVGSEVRQLCNMALRSLAPSATGDTSVWEVSSRTFSALFESNELAKKFVGQSGASVGGGMHIQERPIHRAAAPAPASATEPMDVVGEHQRAAREAKLADFIKDTPAPGSATKAPHWDAHAVSYTLQCLERWAGKLQRAGFTDEPSRCEYVSNIIKADFSEELLPVANGDK